MTSPANFHLPAVIWITGLPAAGKTTLAQHVQAALRTRSVPVVLLDGDDLRRTMNADLGYSVDARRENVRRIGEIARVLLAQGFTVVVACISPFREQRAALRTRSVPVVLLDGDDLRRTVNADLGYSAHARRENVRRIGEIARVLLAQGFTVVVACISPFREQRAALRRTFAAGQFIEVFMDTPIEVCQARDPKGLYRRAAEGGLKEMTGVDSLYEPPLQPELRFQPDEFDADVLLRRFGL